RTLAAALNVQSLHSFALRIQESCARSDQPQARMRLFAKAYLAFQQDEPELWALLFESGMGADTQEYAEAVISVFEPVVESLKPLACSREAARQDAKIIWAALHGMCLLKKHAQLDVEEADPLEALVERFLQRYLP
ncbi:MAG: TetR-like C-terminal domain-containing protein, partial [Verrucomicrobiales bacterium]